MPRVLEHCCHALAGCRCCLHPHTGLTTPTTGTPDYRTASNFKRLYTHAYINTSIHPLFIHTTSWGEATVTTILRGLDWVASHAQRPAVVHMSIEGYFSTIVNAAVGALVAERGFPVVVAAGNEVLL